MHMPEMHMPVMHMPAVFRRQQDSPNTPPHIEFQPQHPPHTQFQPQPSNPNRADVEMGTVWGIPVLPQQIGHPIGQIHPAQQYQYRHRRNVKEAQKGWYLFKNKVWP
ncbi:unnamed protein product [Meloidogyne enterolobii]|uniref:Uncharacterized protein n=1 Tax=Meloidogyne enterolobii TaxID=390850 RepID=A0ACB0Y550_MELEN